MLARYDTFSCPSWAPKSCEIHPSARRVARSGSYRLGAYLTRALGNRLCSPARAPRSHSFHSAQRIARLCICRLGAPTIVAGPTWRRLYEPRRRLDRAFGELPWGGWLVPRLRRRLLRNA